MFAMQCSKILFCAIYSGKFVIKLNRHVDNKLAKVISTLQYDTNEFQSERVS